MRLPQGQAEAKYYGLFGYIIMDALEAIGYLKLASVSLATSTVHYRFGVHGLRLPCFGSKKI